MSKGSERRSIASNRKARHTYQILEELECGIQLKGTEVKSLREGQCSIGEAYVHAKNGELFLIGAHIPEYSHGTMWNHKPTRERKLLLHRRELAQWSKKARERGVTMVPLEVYFSGSLSAKKRTWYRIAPSTGPVYVSPATRRGRTGFDRF